MEEAAMNNNGTPIDLVQFDRRRRQVPWEQIAPYAGQNVAWSADGSHIVAAGTGYDGLAKRLDELGIDSASVVWSYVPPLNEDCQL
jgi:hypothetical protein